MSEEMAVMPKQLNAEALAVLSKKLQSADVGIEATAEYFKPEEGEENRCIYVGNLTMPPMEVGNDDVPAVKFLHQNGKFYVTASAIIVSTFRGYEFGQAFQVIKTGEEKATTGKIHKFQINELYS
jgi:hypothetical protein